MKSVVSIITGLLSVAWMSSTPAYAISIALYDGSNLVICNDEAACDSSLGQSGVVTYNGGIGNFVVNVTTGITYPVLGTQTDAQLDLNSINVSSTGGGSLQVYVSEINYSGNTSFITEAGGTTSGTVEVDSWLSDANCLFCTDSPLGTLGPVSGGAFSSSTSGSGSATGDYSLTLVASITHPEGKFSSTSFDANLSAVPVPEPSSLLLLGSGLVGLAFWGRKRFGSIKD